VVINDFDFIGMPLAPGKANAPLIVDTDAVLTVTITLKLLKPIARQGRKCAQIGGSVEHIQFSQRLPLDGPEALYYFPAEEALGVRTSKGPDHLSSVYCFPVNVN